jgi:dephospho-CoA kinase
MLRLRKVAITGGLSCGKSSVCRFFKELGAYVVSADEIVHQLLSPSQPLGQQVIALLGDEIVVEGKIDRQIVAKKVFENKQLLRSLEKIIHPSVIDEIEKQYQHINSQNEIPLFIAEIPLLFEGSTPTHFDATIAIWAPPELCKKRFMTHTGYGEEEYFKRMANQMPADEKAKRANYVIENSGNLEQLQKAVKKLFIKLTAKSDL